MTKANTAAYTDEMALVFAAAAVIKAAGFDAMAEEFVLYPGKRETTIKVVSLLMERSHLRAHVSRFRELTDKVMVPQRARQAESMRHYIGRDR